MFDIDSTLIFVDGAGITAWAHAFRRLHDIDADIEAFTEHVMTDPEVARLTFIGAVGRPATARELTRLLGAYQKMAMHVDPVCEIHVTAGTAAAIREHLGRKYFLCSAACDSRFTPDPAFYLHQHRKYTNFRPVRGRLTYRAPRGRRRNCILPSSPPLPAGLTPEILDQLVAGVETPADFQLVWRQLQKAMAERVLKAELTHHLGYPEGGERGPDGNARNGSSPKRLLTESGPVDLEVPRDRAGSFSPQFLPKGARRLPSFDETVLMLYARGLSTRELQAFLEERYQIPVSPDLISTVTNEVGAEADTWQQRPLEPVYVAVAFDALRVKIRDEGVVQNKAVYLALGVQPDGTKEVLGFWIAQTEGAAFWQRVFSELQGRGVTDILVALIDGLTGLTDALHAVFPHTIIHQCVVHLVRQSLLYVTWKDRKAVAAALRAIYQAPSEAAARAEVS